MANAVAQAYSGSGGLGAIPQWGTGAKPLVSGPSGLKLKAVLKVREQYCALYLTI